MRSMENLRSPDESESLDSSLPDSGATAMDLAHKNLLNELAHLRDVDDEAFCDRYPALVAAVERDFREEENLMETLGLVSYRAHLEQHARMLAALHCTMSGACSGNTAPARAAVNLLREWLQFHLPGMDRELADALRDHPASAGTPPDGAAH